MFALPNGPGFMAGVPDTRVAYVPAAEPDGDYRQTTAIPALATFQLRSRDSMDFSIDFSNWLAANGNASTVLTAATWTVVANSPSTPILGSSVFNPAGRCSIVLSAALNAKAGDAYWLDLAVTIGVTTVVDGIDVPTPARTMVRRLYVVVVNG